MKHFNDLLKVKPNSEQRLNHYLNKALEVLTNNSLSTEEKLEAVRKLIKVLSLNIQNFITEQVIFSDKPIDLFDTLFLSTLNDLNSCICTINCDGQYKPLSDHEKDLAFSLNSTPVITPMWNNKRMINTFSKISQNLNKPFEYDESNHFACYMIEPFGLVLCLNGTHSTTAGIYDNNGFSVISEVYDVSNWYSYVYFDGSHFRCIKHKRKTVKPEHKDLGIIFEIGRLLIEHKLKITNYELL